MSNDADSHQLLAVVAAVHHERVGEALDDGAVGLSEALDGIAASGVGDVDRGADLDVVAVGEDLVSQNPRQPAVRLRKEHPSPRYLLLSALAIFRRQIGYSRQ